MIEIQQIMSVLKQKYPFLLVDRILDYKLGEYSIGCKNVTIDEFWAQGHFEENPIMPGVLIIEAAAQSGAFIFFDNGEDAPRAYSVLSSVSNFKFLRPVKPGDQLIMRVDLVEQFDYMAKVKVHATVDGARVAQGELTYAFNRNI
jgi:3-hydroxyacyl-[acyl-carrier-protein] dehydratase